jgi:hypothetical protein
LKKKKKKKKRENYQRGGSNGRSSEPFSLPFVHHYCAHHPPQWHHLDHHMGKKESGSPKGDPLLRKPSKPRKPGKWGGEQKKLCISNALPRAS